MAITRIQHKTGSGTGTSLGITPDTTPVNGNFVALTITYNSASSGLVTSITQTNVSWQRAVQKSNTLGGLLTIDVWYAENVQSAGSSLTINLSSSVTVAACFVEYSGVKTSGSLDQIATNEEWVDGGA